MIKQNEYEITGSIAMILLESKGETFRAIVDVDVLPIVQKYRWHIINGVNGKYVGSSFGTRKNRGFVYLHRLVTGISKEFHVDHVNHNTLDNRSSNLRSVTRSENLLNRNGSRKGSLAGLRGVSFHKASGLWMSRLMINRKVHFLGYFKKPEDAGKVSMDFLVSKGIVQNHSLLR